MSVAGSHLHQKAGKKNNQKKTSFSIQERNELNRLHNKMERAEKQRVEVKDGGGGGWKRVEDGEERRAGERRKGKKRRNQSKGGEGKVRGGEKVPSLISD